MLIKEDKDGVLIKIKVQPKASKNEIVGLMEDALKIRLTAPPVDGKANEACIQFLAGLLHIPKKKVELISGQAGRHKIIKLNGLKLEEARKILLKE